MQIQEHTPIRHLPLLDGDLIQQARDGNQRAFEELVQRYHVPLFNFIFHLLQEHDEAYDVLQQVLLQLYLCLPKLHTHQPIKGWLFQVARNRCIDLLRRKRIVHFSELETDNDEDELSPLDPLVDNAPLPDEIAECRDLQQCLRRAITALPEKYSAIVFLRYATQMSFREIGQVLGIPEATAKTYFQRAKPMLRASLERMMQ